MEASLFALITLVLAYVFFNAILSKEILLWEPSLLKRILLILVVWLLPFLGAFIAYKSLNLTWFKDRKKSGSNAQSNISGALLEIDSIFNPGQKHVVEQKENVELTENAELTEKEDKDARLL